MQPFSLFIHLCEWTVKIPHTHYPTLSTTYHTKFLLMILRTSFCLALLCFITSVKAQHTLRGTVTNSQEKGIYFATVALFQTSDSTLISGASTDENGAFELTKIPSGSFYLKAQMLGYSPTFMEDLAFPEYDGKTLTITLNEEEAVLDAVEISAKVPLLEQKADRLVVNVADNLTSLNGNLLNVLKKVPGLLVIGEKVQMAGQQNVTIMINGKSTQYMDMNSLLKDMPGDNIQRVEVIHQPGAEFDAEGTGAIINIVLKKNSLFGTNGSIRGGIAKGEDWKYTTTLSLSHYQGSVNVYGSLSYRDYPYYDELHLTRRVGDDIYDQVSINPYANKSYRGNVGLDWDITKRHRAGMTASYVDWSSDNVIVNNTDILFGNAPENNLRLITQNAKEEGWQMWTFNPYYRFDIDTTGHKIEFDVNWAGITNEGGNTLSSEELNLGANFLGQRYNQPGETSIFTTKLDYTYPISDQLKLQVGAKYSEAELDNDLQAFQEVESNIWIDNPLQSNHFIFDETITAAYGKLTFNKNKWSGTVGLRYEDSNSKGYSVTLDSTLERNISQLFPSASLSREITQELGATVAYSYRIDRPNYSTLNPFVFYLDPFTFERGNPSLAPAFTHSMKFNLTYEKQPFFNVEYKRTNNAMVQVTEQNDATGEASLTTVNLESYNNFSTSLFFPLSFVKGMEGYGGIIANYQKFNSPYLDQQFDQSNWDYTAFLQAEISLPAKMKSTITGWYNSGPMEGIIKGEWMYGVDVGLSKKFWNEKANISFGVDNLFARFMYGSIRYANMDIDMFSRWDGPVYNLQLSFKFGNQHFKSKEQRRGSAAEELSRTQKN